MAEVLIESDWNLKLSCHPYALCEKQDVLIESDWNLKYHKHI